MKWLSLAGYSAVTLDDLLDARAGRRRLPRKPIVITFDDGFQDCITHAIPVLKRHNFTAIVFVVAGLAGQTSRWLRAERGLELPLIDWDTARRLEKDGFHCGAHTMSHPRLATLPANDCRSELMESRMVLEEQLQREVRHLAYPFGSYNETVRSIAEECGYRTACSVRIGLSPEEDDPLALHRIPITGHDTLLDFVWKLRTARGFGEWGTRKLAGVRNAIGSSIRAKA